MPNSSPPGTPTSRQRPFHRETLPGSSPILTSPEESPAAGPSKLPALPPLSSDDLLYTSPIVGNKAERQAKSYAKGVKKRQVTLALAADEVKTKEEIFDEILGQLADNKLLFGDLVLYERLGLATKILNLWVSREISETARAEVDAWAGNYVAERARNEAKEITKSKALQAGGTLDGSYVDGFSMQKMYDFLRLHAKTAMKVLDAFATSPVTPEVMFQRVLPNEPRCQNLIKKAHFLINRSHDIDPEGPLPTAPPSTPVLSDVPYIPPDPEAVSSAIAALRFVRMGTLRQLSGSMRDMAKSIAATGLYAASYDNINMVFRTAEQVLGKNYSQENGTCETIWPLWKARLEDMKIKDFNSAFDKAPPLSIKDILLSAPELELMDKFFRHCILRIIVDHGGSFENSAQLSTKPCQ
ncbi:hypothetical protein B0H13DRAFT_2303587 [Mycena leptocephala]|nr:hypothetical protein B0H13DRAFT_2303587 [Mycena leptocephala]